MLLSIKVGKGYLDIKADAPAHEAPMSHGRKLALHQINDNKHSTPINLNNHLLFNVCVRLAGKPGYLRYVIGKRNMYSGN